MTSVGVAGEALQGGEVRTHHGTICKEEEARHRLHPIEPRDLCVVVVLVPHVVLQEPHSCPLCTDLLAQVLVVLQHAFAGPT